MIILDKQLDKIFILYNPQKEQVNVGENLIIYEPNLPIKPNGVIAQITEEKPYITPGMRESLLLESLAPEVETVATPTELEAAKSELRNQKLLIAKIRLSVHFQNGKVESVMAWTGWSPTPSCKIQKIGDEEILEFIDLKGKNDNITVIGKTIGKAQLDLNLYYLHGITVFIGGRGTGKSHLAKSLALKLVDTGKKVIVFDVNDEWEAMRWNQDGSNSPYYDKIVKIDPGVNASFDLAYLGKPTFMAVLKAMGLEETKASVQKFFNIWDRLGGELSLKGVINEVNNLSDEKVKEALKTRLEQLKGSRILTEEKIGTRIEHILKKMVDGGFLVVNLKEKTRLIQFIIVQLFISKLADILTKNPNETLVLILEEAQIYMEQSDIQEIVTRLRHLGLHQWYITNNPKSLPPFLLTHVNNWFIFNLTNEQDIVYLQNSLPLDEDSALTFIKMLPPRRTLVLINETYKGRNKNYPFIVETNPLPYRTAGITRELYPEP